MKKINFNNKNKLDAKSIINNDYLIKFIKENKINENQILENSSIFLLYKKLEKENKNPVLSYENEIISITYSDEKIERQNNYSKISYNNLFIKNEMSNFLETKTNLKAFLNDKSFYIVFDNENKVNKTNFIKNLLNQEINKQENRKISLLSFPDYVFLNQGFFDINKDEYNNIKNADVLFIDDLGLEQISDKSIQIIQNIINFRTYNKLKTFIFSNLGIENLKAIYKNSSNKKEEIQIDDISNKINNNTDWLIININDLKF